MQSRQIHQLAENHGVDLSLEALPDGDEVARRLKCGHRPQPLAVGAEISRYGTSMRALSRRVHDRLCGADADVVARRAQALVDLGASPDTAACVVTLLHAFCGFDIIDIADMEGRDIDEVADLYYSLNGHLNVDHLLTAISELDRTARWSGLFCREDRRMGIRQRLTPGAVASSSELGLRLEQGGCDRATGCCPSVPGPHQARMTATPEPRPS